MELSVAGLRKGVVAAPHAAAVEAGRAVLAQGGNALEAAVAMAAAIFAAYPHMAHAGGDGFWLIRAPSGRVRALMAGGAAGARATRDFYREHGLDAVPARGPLAALTAPAAMAGWIVALEAARAWGGKLPLSEILGPAIRLARAGVPAPRSLAALAARHLSALREVPGFAGVFLNDGKPVEAGAPLRQEKLAATLEHLAQAGLDDFYRGDVGREIAADLARIGSPVTRADLEACRAQVAEPLSLSLGAGTLYNTPPPTQGLASLVIAGLFERLSVREAEGFAHLHGLIEATKRAFALRDRAITDPPFMTEPAARFLEPAFLDAEARAIDPLRAARWPQPGRRGDTVWMGAADASGLVVSMLQSVYWEFGAGVVLPATGVLMTNRGTSFSLDPRALNALQPGRYPFHTLTPALAVLRDGRVIGYGSMGGDGQPQFQSAFFTRHALFRQPLAEAIAAPRWLLGRTWGDATAGLRLEGRFSDALVDRLAAAGHDVQRIEQDYDDLFGHLGAVALDPRGTIEGAHDPRADGGAAGL